MANTQRQAHRPELAGTQSRADAKKSRRGLTDCDRSKRFEIFP